MRRAMGPCIEIPRIRGRGDTGLPWETLLLGIVVYIIAVELEVFLGSVQCRQNNLRDAEIPRRLR